MYGNIIDKTWKKRGLFYLALYVGVCISCVRLRMAVLIIVFSFLFENFLKILFFDYGN